MRPGEGKWTTLSEKPYCACALAQGNANPGSKASRRRCDPNRLDLFFGIPSSI